MAIQSQQKSFPIPWENQISPAARDQSILQAKPIFNGERLVLSHGSRETQGRGIAQLRDTCQGNQMRFSQQWEQKKL